MPITTERLTLRPFMAGDGKQVFEAIEESREHLKQWCPWVEGVKIWEDSEKKVREFHADFILRKELSFFITKDRKFIGVCSLHGFNWTIPSAAIGYWCRSSEQGKGYIRESIAALTLYGFQQMKLRRITLLCDDENKKSIAIPEALGFALETTAKGLLAKPGDPNLRLGRRYVRFDANGLENCKIQW